jgi:chromosomal replication initiator protein
VISDAHHLWTTCAALLRAQVSDLVWHTAFDGVRAVDFDGEVLTLGVPSALAKERIEGRYLGLVRDAMAEVGASHAELRLRIDPAEPPPLWTVPAPNDRLATQVPELSRSGAAGDGHAGARSPNGPGRPADELGDEELNPRYTFENFVIGGSNRFAHAAAQSVAEMRTVIGTWSGTAARIAAKTSRG